MHDCGPAHRETCSHTFTPGQLERDMYVYINMLWLDSCCIVYTAIGWQYWCVCLWVYVWLEDIASLLHARNQLQITLIIMESLHSLDNYTNTSFQHSTSNPPSPSPLVDFSSSLPQQRYPPKQGKVLDKIANLYIYQNNDNV
jgi:hypothetical protein